MKKSKPAIKEMAQIQSTLSRAFLHVEEKRGVTEKTYNNSQLKECVN